MKGWSKNESIHSYHGRSENSKRNKSDIKEGAEMFKIIDNSNYKLETSHDGGNYRFTTNYILNAEGTYDVYYKTSSDFDYCDICGSFYQNRCASDCNESDRQTATHEQLYAIMSAAITTGDREVWVDQ